MESPRQYVESFLQAKAAVYSTANDELTKIFAKYFTEPLFAKSSDLHLLGHSRFSIEREEQSDAGSAETQVIAAQTLKPGAFVRTRYHVNLDSDGGRIQRLERVCLHCKGTGRRGDGICPLCDGTKWRDSPLTREPLAPRAGVQRSRTPISPEDYVSSFLLDKAEIYLATNVQLSVVYRKYFAESLFLRSSAFELLDPSRAVIEEVKSSHDLAAVLVAQAYSERFVMRNRYHLVPDGIGWRIKRIEEKCPLCLGTGIFAERVCWRCTGEKWYDLPNNRLSKPGDNPLKSGSTGRD